MVGHGIYFFLRVTGSRNQSNTAPTPASTKAGPVTYIMQVTGGWFTNAGKTMLPMKRDIPMQLTMPIRGFRTTMPAV